MTLNGPDYFKQAVELVSLKHRLPLKALLPGRGRRGLAVESLARDELFWILRQRGWSWPRIGQLTERNHVSALKGAERHARRQSVPLEPQSGYCDAHPTRR